MRYNNDSTRKPHNYSNELTPAQLEELAKIEAAAAGVKRIKEIGDAQRTFNKISLNFGNDNGDSSLDYRPRSKTKRRRRPSVEQVAIARGIIKMRPLRLGLELELEEAGH